MDRCLYKSKVNDSDSNLPVYVLDSTFFPLDLIHNFGNNQSQFQSFTDQLSLSFPPEPFSLVLFTNGFHKYDSSATSNFKLPLNLMKFLKFIPQETKQHMLKIYIVHGNWLSKSIVEILRKFLGFDLAKTIIHCENLSVLSDYLDITKLPISLQTYLIDKIQYNNPKLTLNNTFESIYGKPLILEKPFPLIQFSKIYNNLIAYLTNEKLDIVLSASDWNTVIRCAALNDETKIAVDILSSCLKRDQNVVLSDYSFLEHFMIIVKFILKLSNSKEPLINLEAFKNVKTLGYSSVANLNEIFNKALIFKYKVQNSNGQEGSYDNAYILIKLFKLFKHLLLKLERECELLEPNAKNQTKRVERQRLRLILAYTKILYSDLEENDDDSSFDSLFRFIQNIMEHYDQLTVLDTDYTIEDFNNFMSFDDFSAFEDFKNKLLGTKDQLPIPQKDEPKTQGNKKQPTSPIKAKARRQSFRRDENNNVEDDSFSIDLSPPTPPLPRKTKLLSINDPPVLHLEEELTHSPSPAQKTESDVVREEAKELEAEVTIPITKSEMDILVENVEDFDIGEINEAEDNQLNTSAPIEVKTPRKPVKPIKLQSKSFSTPSKNQLVRPSEQISTKFIKYTEKDRILAEQAEKERQIAEEKEKDHKELEKSAIRGERKVSRLARMYEEKILGN